MSTFKPLLIGLGSRLAAVAEIKVNIILLAWIVYVASGEIVVTINDE